MSRRDFLGTLAAMAGGTKLLFETDHKIKLYPLVDHFIVYTNKGKFIVPIASNKDTIYYSGDLKISQAMTAVGCSLVIGNTTYKRMRFTSGPRELTSNDTIRVEYDTSSAT